MWHTCSRMAISTSFNRWARPVASTLVSTVWLSSADNSNSEICIVSYTKSLDSIGCDTGPWVMAQSVPFLNTALFWQNSVILEITIVCIILGTLKVLAANSICKILRNASRMLWQGQGAYWCHCSKMPIWAFSYCNAIYLAFYFPQHNIIKRNSFVSSL